MRGSGRGHTIYQEFASHEDVYNSIQCAHLHLAFQVSLCSQGIAINYPNLLSLFGDDWEALIQKKLYRHRMAAPGRVYWPNAEELRMVVLN